MTVWITRRDESAVGADVAASAGPLAGLRLAVKDNVDVAGLPTTAGCPDYSYVPDRDAAAVSALTAAGAVVIGKTNMDQFATGLVGTRSPYGAVPDHRRPEYISGGSSSGSAVAVATGEADIAIGTDTAGSGRIPAALQGIVGIKPTRGVISVDGVVPACRTFDCVTIFARDLMLANRTMAEMAAGAPDRQWPTDARLAAPPRPTVAVFTETPELDETWRAAFDRSVEALQASGVRVVRVDGQPFLAAARLLYDGALVAERYAAVGEFIDSHPKAVDAAVRGIVQGARGIGAHQFADDMAELERLRAVAMAGLDGADALMLPTAPFHPTIAEVRADPVAVNSRMGTYTNFCNLFDMCATAVPAGVAGPAQFGVTILGRAFDDAVVFDIAARLRGEEPPESVWPMAAADVSELTVFGAHLRGQPLEYQLTELGARWSSEVRTAPRYRFGVLDTIPPKPAVVRCDDDERGVSVLGERWRLSPAALGRFLAALPAPMHLGAVEFDDGTWGTAFGCDAVAGGRAKDISIYGGWRAAMAAGAV